MGVSKVDQHEATGTINHGIRMTTVIEMEPQRLEHLYSNDHLWIFTAVWNI